MEGGGQDLFDQIYFELELVTNLTKYLKYFAMAGGRPAANSQLFGS